MTKRSYTECEAGFDPSHVELRVLWALAEQMGWRMLCCRRDDTAKPSNWYTAEDDQGRHLPINAGSPGAIMDTLALALISRSEDPVETAGSMIELLVELGWRYEAGDEDGIERLVLPQEAGLNALLHDALDPDAQPTVAADGMRVLPMSAYEPNLLALKPGTNTAIELARMLAGERQASSSTRRAAGLIASGASQIELVLAAVRKVSYL